MSHGAPLPSVLWNPAFQGYRCVLCGGAQPAEARVFVCPACGVDGILDPVLDLSNVRPRFGNNGDLWDFQPLLPVEPEAAHPAWSVGGTPAQPAPRLADHLGVARLTLKNDTVLPSASLKDRAAAVAIAHAHHLGLSHLACASTGNAAASLAVLAARAGFGASIFVPASAPKAKLAQLLLHGADVVTVDGTYDQAFDLSIARLAEEGWYSRNCAHNPLLVEGKKTAVLELIRDLTDDFTVPSAVPDAVFVPVGDGCIVSSTAKGLLELYGLDLIPRVPRVIGVQADGAAPLARAWAAASDPAGMTGAQINAAIVPVIPDTVADSISVGVPRNRIKAWQYVARTGGAFLKVPDADILQAIRNLAGLAGLFAEPSGATGCAGIGPALAAGLISPSDSVAVLVTGHGLKDPEAALPGLKLPVPVPPLT